ncbi:TonB-dependent receptor domain-containing protein [Rufibacter sediminis]|uniref:TonB-dependent receptor n=1 Tax=Rufibacter sediminis TaxID=2762756 RepID=A0ABR6VMQ3_9BACT|nr:TonB-dependent receptor [Rufibacter sediminis]MBC3538474.1 TonB-dependent receptor [Rufibacter sediminis]
MRLSLLSLLFFLCCFSSNLLAQTAPAAAGGGKVTGVVVDSASAKPVEFATISLISAASGKPVDGTITNAQGQFTLPNVAHGTYTLSVSFLGFDAKTLPAFSLTEANKTVHFPNIGLKASATKLKEVTVVGEKPLVEDKGDKLVYNAENDASNQGTTASDVLRKVPSVTVDADGNVQLRGSSNLRVLINGKPSSILANNLAEALKQIPSDIIRNVEVITSPSAKYDAEGTAGIINIITKKNSLQGVNGQVSATAGNRGRYTNGSLNARRGKFGANASLSLYGNNNHSEASLTRTPKLADISYLRQEGTSRQLNNGLYSQLGFTFDPDTLNTFNLEFGTYRNRFRGTRFQRTEDNRGIQLYDLNNRWNGSGLDMNFGYTHTFKPQQELSVLAQVNRGNSHDIYDNSIMTLENAFVSRQLNDNDAPNREKTFQLDYTQTFKNASRLELGLKSILRDATSNAQYNFFRPGKADSLAISNFDFDQDVYATYLTYAFSLKKKYNFNLGSRYEFTNTKGVFLNTAKNEPDLVRSSFKNDYQNFIPSVTVSRTFKQIHTVKASYTQRIQRPQIWYLNPFMQQEDPNNVYQGNPELDAELTHAYELGYNTYFKTTSINASLFYRQTDNAIQQINREAGPNVILTTPENIAKNKVYGVSLSGSTKPVPKWSISPNFNLSYVDLKGETLSNSGLQYNLSLNTSYEFSKGITAQFYGNYNSPTQTAQGEWGSYFFSNVSIKKKFLKDKASLSLNVGNPFNKTLRFTSTINTPAFVQESINANFARRIGVTFNYSFGKMDSAQRQKKSIQNDDAMGGGK